MRSLFRRIRAREEGLTLIELTTVSALLMIVVVAMLTSFSVVQRASVRQSARSEATDEIRLAMERITKDTRQAERVRSASTTTVLDIDTFVSGVETRVTYTIAGGLLTRASNGSTRRLLERVQAGTVFAYEPSIAAPSTIKITIQVIPEHFLSDNAVVELTSEVQLRNI